jgi:hypothetical protein
MKKYKEESEANAQIFADAIQDDEELSAVMNDVVNGVPFRVAIAKHLSPEDIVALKEDENYPSYEDAIKERDQRLKDKKAWADKSSGAMNLINEFASENFADDEDGKNDFFRLLNAIIKADVTKEDLEMLNRGRTHGKDVAAASEAAALKAKNEAITAPKKEKGGDGLPNMSSTTAVPTETKQESDELSEMKRLVAEKKKSQL